VISHFPTLRRPTTELRILGTLPKDFIVANNKLGGLSILETESVRFGGEYGEYASGVKDGTVISYVDKNVEVLSHCTRFGIETPWKPDASYVTEGVKFFNFNGNGSWFQDEFFPEGCTSIDA